MIRKILVLSMWAAVVLVLCSCGKADVRKASGRIAAPFNGEEISVHQAGSVLARSNKTTPELSGRSAALAQQRIIDQELLAQKALQSRLDSNVHVAQAIERARRQILAQAYIERTVISASPASPEEIGKFYEENPALFGQRRVYRVLDMVVAVAPEQTGALQDAVEGAKSLAEVVRWLDSRKLPFEAAVTTNAAEQIPMNMLRRLFEMHDGQMAVFATSRGVSVVRLEQSAEAPLSEKQARPAIARYLFNRKRLELAQAEVTKLREGAKIAYDGNKTVRAANAAQTDGRAHPVSGPEVAYNPAGFARLR